MARIWQSTPVVRHHKSRLRFLDQLVDNRFCDRILELQWFLEVQNAPMKLWESNLGLAVGCSQKWEHVGIPSDKKLQK